MGLFSRFYAPPGVNQIWTEDRKVLIKHHNEESWLELFIDLAYVALFIGMGSAIEKCDLNEYLLSHAALIFLIMFFYRLTLDNYSNRFSSDDVLTRILYFAYTYGVALMIMNVKGADEFTDSCPHMGLNTKGFLVGWLGARLSILIMYGIALYNNKHVIPQFAFDMLVSLILFIVGLCAFTPGIDRVLFYKITLPLEFLLSTPLLGSKIRPLLAELLGIAPSDGVYYIIPLNIQVYQRRLCMFVMMVLGEGIIQILDPNLNEQHLIRCYSYATCGLILIFSFAMLYCDAVLREHLDHHALRRSAFSGAIWVYMHGPMAFFMYLVGISIKLSYHDVVADYQIHKQSDVLLGVACGAVVLCLAISRSRHKGSSVFLIEAKTAGERLKKRNRIFNYAVRIIIALLHWLAAIQTFRIKSHDVLARDRYLYFHCALASGSVAFEVILSYFSSTKEHDGAHDSHYDDDNSSPSERDTISGSVEKEDGRTSRIRSVNAGSESRNPINTSEL